MSSGLVHVMYHHWIVDRNGIEESGPAVMPIFERHGAQMIVGDTARILGDDPPTRFVMNRFDGQSTAHAFRVSAERRPTAASHQRLAQGVGRPVAEQERHGT